MDRKTREQLQQEIDTATWDMLEAHLERGGLISVSPDLDLAGIAKAVAEDDAQHVERLLQDGSIGKPTREQIEVWTHHKGKRFSFLIVQPFVFIQEQAH